MSDSNYFLRVTVATTSFPGAAQFIVPSGTDPSISLINEGPDTIRYSFDGSTVHGDMVPGTSSSSLIFNHRGVSKIWFKGVSGSSTQIRCESSAAGTFGGASGNGSTSSSVTLASSQVPLPVKGTVTARATLTASASLPAAGAYESPPADNVMVAVPSGSRRAIVYVSYTRGASSGQAAHKLYISNGTDVAQVMSVDGTFNGLIGAASTSASPILYAIPLDLIGGETKIGIASAEVGVTGTPGSYSTTVTFG